eukprot:TRINITY_DN412_c0_g1_i5.p1 TRINITY_DN412_c0_g1~~TRINITY_DN412_c0_g1_i5.p1  ORF type:complete len:863 (+),score=373.10 TRINITY_DN412_c0_g1_i5:124-2712(+)
MSSKDYTIETSDEVRVVKIPSNETIVNAMDKEIKTLERVEQNPSLSYKGERIVEDVKRILKDEEALLYKKNGGENAQRLLKNTYLMAMDLAHDDRFSSLFDNWSAILTSASRSGDWSEITRAMGSLATDLRDTESFIRLLTELQTTVKLLLAEKVDKASADAERLAQKAVNSLETATQIADNQNVISTEQKDKAENLADRAASKTEHLADKARGAVHSATGVSSSSEPLSERAYTHSKDKNRKKLLHQLDLTLKDLNNNPTWRFMVSKSKSAGQTVQAQGLQPAGELVAAVTESPRAQLIAADIKATVQSIVGDKVDVEPFFLHTRNAITFVLDNPTYPDLLDRTQQMLTAIAHSPELLDDERTLDKLDTLQIELQNTLDTLKDHPDVIAARTQGHKLVEAIMKDPASAKLVKDTRTLIRHLQSVQPGHLMDPALIHEIRGLLVPLVLEHLADVPVPSVSDVTDTAVGKFEYTAQNIHINVRELVPDNIHIKFKYDLDAHPVSLSYERQHAIVVFEARDIQVHLRDVDWAYKRLTTPHLHDSGRMNLDTEGHGVNIRVKFQMKKLGESEDINKAGQHVQSKEVLTLLESKCYIDRFKTHFSDSKHDKLYEAISGVFAARIKKQVEELIMSKMSHFAEVFNHKIWIMVNEAKIRKEEARYRLDNKKDSMRQSWFSARKRVADSTPVQKAKDAAMEKGKEALKIGLERARDAPSVGAAVSGLAHDARDLLSDAKDKAEEVKDKVASKAEDVKDKVASKAEDVKEKAGEVKDKVEAKADAKKEGEVTHEHDYVRVPLSFRDYAPVPAATFISAEPEATSTLGDVPNTAKYPISVMAPELLHSDKKEKEKEKQQEEEKKASTTPSM